MPIKTFITESVVSPVDTAFVWVDPAYGWVMKQAEGRQCFVKGWFTLAGKTYADQAAADILIQSLPQLNGRSDLAEFLRGLSGNFAFIFKSPQATIAAVDKKRSFPVFYSSRPAGLFLSNAARVLQEQLKLKTMSLASLLEFRMAGYVTGRFTLYEDLQQLQAGEFLQTDSGGAGHTEKYYRYYPETRFNLSEPQLTDELVHVSRQVFQSLIERLNGRPVWVPLSAGLDSRFIVAMLKECGYDNIQAFFYGAPGSGNWEGRYSQQLAAQLNIPWRRLDYTPKYLKSVFRSALWHRFGAFADNLCSLPGYNMLYNLEALRQANCLPADAVMINGQTGDFISGNHLPALVESARVTRDEIFVTVAAKHFSLWEDLKTAENLNLIRQRFESLTAHLPFDGSGRSAAGILDHWEWRERQAKYILNGQRGYEFYKLGWELPLWDDRFMNFWKKVPVAFKFQQRLFRDFLKIHNPAKAFRNYDPNRRPAFLKQAVSRGFSWLVRPLPLRQQERLKRRYLTAFMDPYNAHSVFPAEDLRESAWSHRNAISYYARYHIQDAGLKLTINNCTQKHE